jgi:hypothetical protein
MSWEEEEEEEEEERISRSAFKDPNEGKPNPADQPTDYADDYGELETDVLGKNVQVPIALRRAEPSVWDTVWDSDRTTLE